MCVCVCVYFVHVCVFVEERKKGTQVCMYVCTSMFNILSILKCKHLGGEPKKLHQIHVDQSLIIIRYTP